MLCSYHNRLHLKKNLVTVSPRENYSNIGTVIKNPLSEYFIQNPNVKKVLRKEKKLTKIER